MTSFGYQIPGFRHGGRPDDEIFDATLAHAQAAEAGGFASLWVMDHFWQLPALGGPDEPILEAYTLLGALAARTARVELGALVTGVTYRNPALLAKMVTTLDVISHGRAILGLGAAWYAEEHQGYGFAFPTAGERLDRALALGAEPDAVMAQRASIALARGDLAGALGFARARAAREPGMATDSALGVVLAESGDPAMAAQAFARSLTEYRDTSAFPKLNSTALILRLPKTSAIF